MAVFSSMEANVMACGQSYTPQAKDKEGKVVSEEKFNSIRQIDISIVLFSADVQEIIT